jgi:hypothetical protein
MSLVPEVSGGSEVVGMEERVVKGKPKAKAVKAKKVRQRADYREQRADCRL